MGIVTSHLKPGDRIIWLRSPGRSFLTGWRVERLPGVIDRVCDARIRIRVLLEGREKVVNVMPENVMSEADTDEAILQD